MRERIQSCLIRGVLLATTCLVVSIAQAASDAPATPPPTTPPAAAPATAPQKQDDRQARWRADRRAFFEARVAALHAGLQLKPDQDALWPPVESAIRGFAKLRADRWAAMKGEETSGQGDTALERLRQRSERLIARGQAMKTLADAAAPLVASLDATQKDRLPRLLEGLRPRRVLGEALDGGDRGRDDREGGHGMRRERAERYGMRGDERTGREGGDRHWDRHWDRREGLAERDGMRDDRRDDGDMPMHRHHHHDDEGSDRT